MPQPIPGNADRRLGVRLCQMGKCGRRRRCAGMQILMDEAIARFPGSEKVNFDSDDIEKGMKSDQPFLAGLQALQKSGVKLEKDVLGLIHDRDVLAFWGDPRWDARFDPKRQPRPITASWTKSPDGLMLTLAATADYQGTLPLWLPERLANPTLKPPDGAKIAALAADDYLLIRKITISKGEQLKLLIASQRQ